MSRSSGVGSPIHFRCRKCRSFAQHVQLTGQKAPFRSSGKSGQYALGYRSTLTARQYKCNHCCHIGWSNHVDLEQKEKAQEKKDNGS